MTTAGPPPPGRADRYGRAAMAGDGTACQQIAEAYLARADRINNWDLVDARSDLLVRGRGTRMRTDMPM